MVRRVIKIIAVMLLIPAAALAALKWSEETPALKTLKEYTEKVNELLAGADESPVNSLFANFPKETVMGITAEENAEIPESVEITVKLYYDTLDSLQLRVSEVDRLSRPCTATP